jgi:4-hydroxybenzoyl-CoA thioesterase
MAVTYERPIRFEEVDAAQLLFFGRYLTLCHEAMEHFFAPLSGGYVSLIHNRRIGFPAVHVEASYRSPLRYGDTAVIETSVSHVGTTSTTFRYVFRRRADKVHCATISHVVVASNLDSVTKVPLPEDCRALLHAHLEGAPKNERISSALAEVGGQRRR